MDIYLVRGDLGVCSSGYWGWFNGIWQSVIKKLYYNSYLFIDANEIA